MPCSWVLPLPPTPNRFSPSEPEFALSPFTYLCFSPSHHLRASGFFKAVSSSTPTPVPEPFCHHALHPLRSDSECDRYSNPPAPFFLQPIALHAFGFCSFPRLCRRPRPLFIFYHHSSCASFFPTAHTAAILLPRCFLSTVSFRCFHMCRGIRVISSIFFSKNEGQPPLV